MSFKTVFTALDNAINGNEEAYDRAWLDLINYKGTERLEVVMLENTLKARHLALQASKEAQLLTYYALPN